MTNVNGTGKSRIYIPIPKEGLMPKLRIFLCSLIPALTLAAQTAQKTPAIPVPHQPMRMSAAQIQTQNVEEVAPVAKFPRVNVLHQDFGRGCPGVADATGKQDSTCALQAAIDYAASQTVGGQMASLYFPAGNYLISKSLRLPCTLQVLTDGPTASSITLAPGVKTNAITVHPPDHLPADGWLCAGGIDGLEIQGSGHENTGTLLEIINGSGYRLNDVKLFNSGGRGLSLQGSSERIESHNLEIDAVRWPIVMAGNSNEDHFFKTNIDAPGVAGDNYCFSVNCVDGKYPGPNQGPGGSATPIRPDTHAAVWLGGSNVGFYTGSIKSLEYTAGIQTGAVEADMIANIYFENFPDHNRPNLNSAIIEGGTLPSTKLSETLPGSCQSDCSAAVASTDWFPDYTGDPSDIERYLPKNCGEEIWIMPADFEWGNNAPSASAPGVTRTQFEMACLNGMSSDGKMHLGTRHITGEGPLSSTASAGVSWPAGSIVHMVERTLAYGSGLTLMSNHMSGLSPGKDGYQANCNDADTRVCGNIILGLIPDGYFYNPPGSKANAQGMPAGAMMTLINNSMFVNGPESLGVGYIKVHTRGALTILGTSGNMVQHSASGDVLSGQQSYTGLLPIVQAVQYPTGTHAQVMLTRPEAGSFLNTNNGFFEQAITAFDQNLGANPGGRTANGHQFADSSCWYDIGSTQSPHAGNRFCMKGGPQLTGTNPGWEYDVWNGKQWVNAFSVDASGNVKTSSLQLGGSNSQVKSLSGNGTALATVSGPLVSGHVLVADANGNIRDGGAAPTRAALDNGSSVQGFGGSSINSSEAFPVITCSFSQEGYTASVGSTPLCAIPRTGTYEITLNAHPTSIGTAGQLLSANVRVAPTSGAPVQACSIGTPMGLSGSSPQQFAGPCMLHIDAGQVISFDASAEKLGGGAAYGLSILVKQVQ